MATRSNIALKLRAEDTNKTFTTPWGEKVKPNGKGYLQIYVHNDGYPSGVGLELDGNQLTYDEALEFILEGDRSTLGTSYWAWRKEECPPIPTEEPSYDEDYLYVLEETAKDEPCMTLIAVEDRTMRYIPIDVFMENED